MAYTTKTALLANIIDYAGTFPPAALSLPDALKRAATFRREGRHPWLMAKVAMPIADLKKIPTRALYEAGADGAAWLFTALGGTPQGDSAADFLRAVEWDLREIRHWHARVAEGPIAQRILAYETKLPTDFGTTSALEFLSPVLKRFRSLTAGAITPFFEVSFEGDWRRRTEAVADALVSWSDDQDEADLAAGLKIRTAGKVMPTAEQVAEVVIASSSRGLRFKATQGLHEAVTRGDSLGFVNLFAALTFAQAYGEEKFGKGVVARCLKTEKAAEFKFEADRFSWGEFELTVDEIESARRSHGGCFGSCSVDEPDESLSKTFKE